jgi:uncharacterized protein (TIGR03083 family)
VELDRDSAAELLGAYALDALDAAEADAVERALAAFPDLRVEVARLGTAVGALAAADATPPPGTLRERVLDVARRAPRRPAPPDDVIPLYRRQVAELAAVLDTVPERAWSLDTAAGWTIHELVAHLVGVEAYVASRLDLGDFVPPPGTEHDHVGMTVPIIDAERLRHPSETRQAWERSAWSVVGLLEAAGPDLFTRRIDLYGIPTSARTAVVARMFELWTHADDVRRALGQPLVDPDAERLAAMSDVATRSLPTGMTLSGKARPGQSAKVVLLGGGGGTWTVPLALGDAGGPPAVTVVADVVDFCRVAATRLDPASLDHDVEGDPELAGDVLRAVAIFAA